VSRPLFVDSRRTLLGSLIDYAGLFPPASLSLPEAVAEYREAHRGPHAWMLGTFVTTASRLDDLAGLLVRTMAAGEEPWEISVILDGDIAGAAASAASFSAVMEPAAVITKVEAVLPPTVTDPSAADLARADARRVFDAATSVSASVMPFLEIPMTTNWEKGLPGAVAIVADLRSVGGRPVGAKLRCGGLSPEDFPTPGAVTAFMIACRDAGLIFKATAGLHHPIRHFDREIGVTRHGFLNLLVAATLAESGADSETVTAVIAEEEPGAFSIGAAGVTWRDRHAGAESVQRTRSARFSAYGSCSFDEPIADLESLGILSAAPA
jgi:hypothetical protein